MSHEVDKYDRRRVTTNRHDNQDIQDITTTCALIGDEIFRDSQRFLPSEPANFAETVRPPMPGNRRVSADLSIVYVMGRYRGRSASKTTDPESPR